MLDKVKNRIEHEKFVELSGRVLKVNRESIRTSVPNVQVGSICRVETRQGPVALEVVSLDPRGHVAMPLDDLANVRLGDRVTIQEDTSAIPVGDALLGQVVDSLCRPYSNEKILLPHRIELYGTTNNPMDRQLIRQPLDLGVRSINACLTCGKGQRQGIFAGSGVGKSVLLGMMARYTAADVVVIGLIGERGREVKEFIEHELGPQGRKKSVVVVETSDKSPVRRVRGAYVSTAVAEYFRNQGAQVLLLMDSLTRFAMAQREIGIAAGEPPTTKGYTPSVFSHLAKLLERAGNWGMAGTITGLYTVLVEGDDLDDPVADNARAILDGHIVLSRKLANRGHFPAIDVLSSVSRVMDQIVSKDQKFLSRLTRETLARYLENEDAIQYGMYARGTDPRIDESIDKEPLIKQFLTQDRDTAADLANSVYGMSEIFSEYLPHPSDQPSASLSGGR